MYNGYIVDPQQQNFLKKKLLGDNILLGAAGTGKTNIAIAKAIALSYQENPGDTLFVSYTNALVKTCREDIKKLFADAALFEQSHVKVTTFHKLASDIHNELYGRRISFLSDQNKNGFIRKALMNCTERYPDGVQEYGKDLDIFIEEITFLQSFDIKSLEEYENTVRSNQKVKLIRKAARKYYWYVYQEYLHLVQRFYNCDFSGTAQFFLEFTDGKSLHKYKNIFIDEGQDFSPAALRAINRLLDTNGMLLYLGDATQEIYGSRLSWKSVGLSVNNKIVRLNKSFRNSIEIGKFATDILDQNKWEAEPGEILYPKGMLKHGKKPAIVKSPISSLTDAAIVNYIQSHSNESICVLCYAKADVTRISKILAAVNIENQNSVSQNFSNHTKVTISTYFSVKGLEFDTVILANLNSQFLNNINFLSKDNKEEITSLATKLLYVAVTRAKSRLIIFYDDELPCIFPQASKYFEEIELNSIDSYFEQKDAPIISTTKIVSEMAKSTFLSKEDLIFKLRTAIMKATKELDIQSPWMTSRVVDDLFLDRIERLLSKGVTVKITYGIEDEYNTKAKNTATDAIVELLSNRFKSYSNFKLKKGNSHSKILLCDDAFGVLGSFNWLSYDGKSPREESGNLIIAKEEINDIRSRIFNF